MTSDLKMVALGVFIAGIHIIVNTEKQKKNAAKPCGGLKKLKDVIFIYHILLKIYKKYFYQSPNEIPVSFANLTSSESGSTFLVF